MESKKKRLNAKKCSYDLPPELWTDHIFPVLPVKSLCKLRSVCKSWRSFIDDPSIVSKHFQLSKNNLDKNRVLVIKQMGHRGAGGLNLTLRHRKTLKKPDHVFQTIECYNFLVSCNGLFLLEYLYPLCYLGEVELWNPSIRKALLLPRCPGVTRTNYHNFKYILGFRPSCNEYVVHGFWIDVHTPMKLSRAVYTLSQNLWRIREDSVCVPRWLIEGFQCHPTICGDRYVSLDGALHWFGYDPNDDDPNRDIKSYLVSFNFETEEFSYLELPDARQDLKTPTHKFVFVIGESLAVFSISSERSCIWVLKKDEGVKLWNLWFTRESSEVGFNYISNHSFTVPNFYVEDGGVVMVCGKVAYRITTDEIQKLMKSLCYNLILDTYVESLVLLKGCEGQLFKSLHTPKKKTSG